MVRPGRDRLFGRVEVDETYWGSEEESVRGRHTENKALIVIAAQEDGAGIGRIRVRCIADAVLRLYLHGMEGLALAGPARLKPVNAKSVSVFDSPVFRNSESGVAVRIMTASAGHQKLESHFSGRQLGGWGTAQLENSAPAMPHESATRRTKADWERTENEIV